MCIIVLVLSLALTIVEVFALSATEILYVLPDNSTSAVSCPSQPCATLSQYVLDNGTLPVVSNVEYHFLPGEHHVPANITFQNLYNFSIIGTTSNFSLPVMLVGCKRWYVIDVLDSQFITINNVMIKHCEFLPENKAAVFTLYCCFSCKIQDVVLVQYGLLGFNLIGNSYLHNIKITQFSQLCCQEILLQYGNCQSLNDLNNYIHNLTINQIFIDGYKHHKVTLYINFDYSTYYLKIFLQNSSFYNTSSTALKIKGEYFTTTKQIFISNCTFKFNNAIYFRFSPFNINLSFINYEFVSNAKVIEISIQTCRVKTAACEILITNAKIPIIPTNMSFLGCQFINNSGMLLLIKNKASALSKLNILFKSINISSNYIKRITESDMILLFNMNVRIAGTFNITKNRYSLSIIHLQSCDILLSGKIIFDKNICAQVILLDTYIKIMEYT